MGKENLDLFIEGMTCASCVLHVEKALKTVPGVTAVTVNLATEKASVTSSGVATLDLITAVKKAGYEATPVSDGGNRKSQFSESPAPVEILICCLITLVLVVPMLSMNFNSHWMIPVLIQAVLAGIVQFGFGFPFFVSSWKAIRTKSANMDLLVSMGTSAAYGLSLWKMKTGSSDVYFESSAVVITLVLLGRWIESRAKKQTFEAIHSLQALRPLKARVIRNGVENEEDIHSILLGDLVIVHPGEQIPVDGVIYEGNTHTDESPITGESLPVAKGSGDSVLAGSLNVDGKISIITRSLADQSLLSEVIRTVEKTQSVKAPIQKMVDRVSEVFVPIVVAGSLVTLLIWGFGFGTWEAGLINAIAVLVIACPCAMGLATPTAILVGTGMGARRGILIQNPEILELARKISTVVFDKTGTLTEGKPKVTYLKSFGITDEAFLRVVAGIQNGGGHLLARAVLDYAQDRRVPIPRTESSTLLPGKGASAQLDGKLYYLGNRKLMQERSVSLAPLEKEAAVFEGRGETLSWLAHGTELLGFISFSDSVKRDAVSVVSELKSLGIHTVILTGDHAASAERVAKELGVDAVLSNLDPTQKVAELTRLKFLGPVAMVGDGVNDAPALAEADIGIAMATGTDVAIQSADITLMRGDLRLVPDAIQISRQTHLKIRQNLFWAFVFNAVGIPLAASGFLSPVLAGSAMAFSSVCVVSNSLLLKRARLK